MADGNGKHLKIVVPYRDREKHLGDFLEHIRDYLGSGDISYHIVIAEQEAGLPFNRGAIKNAGFLLGGASDYTCFHDVDYLPLTADYGWPEAPTCLVGVGTDAIPVKLGEPSARIKLDMTKFFGGAVLMPDALFRQVDGYSNDYWGWGFEDKDLVSRFEAAAISPVRRGGAFCPLLHDSDGYEADGGLNDTAAFNRALYLKKWRSGKPEKADGLSTLSHEILSRWTLPGPREGTGKCEQIKVRLFRPEMTA